MELITRLAKPILACTVICLCILHVGCKSQKEIGSASGIEQKNQANTTIKSEEFTVYQDSLTTQNLNEPKLLIGENGIHFEITVPDSIPTILIKVLPQVEFYLQGSIQSTSRPILKCNFEGKSYTPMFSFNYLTANMDYTTEIKFEDRILALIYLFEGYDQIISINKIESASEYLHENLPVFNYKVNISIKEVKDDIYLVFEDNIFFFMGKKVPSTIRIVEILDYNYKIYHHDF